MRKVEKGLFGRVVVSDTQTQGFALRTRIWRYGAAAK